MNTNDSWNALNQMVKELGIEDEFEKLADTYQKQYMISGEITMELEEVLERADDSLIEMLWKEIGEEVSGETENISYERSYKEEILLKRIPEVFEEELIYMEPEEVQLLVSVAAGRELQESDWEMLVGNPVQKGYIFVFYCNDGCVPVVMKSVAERLSNGLKDTKKQLEIAFVHSVRTMLKGCLNLYGVFERKILGQLFQQIIALEGEEEKTLKALRDSMDIVTETLCDREGWFWIDGEYIIDNLLENKKAYRELLKKQQGKEYYFPQSWKEIKAKSGMMADEEDDNYKGMLKVLSIMLRDKAEAKYIMELLAIHVVTDDFSMADAMNWLFMQSEDIVFVNETAGKNFARLCSRWLHGMKRWRNRGYSDAELGIPNHEENAQTQVAESKMKKPQRNDLCPCGSGKKYKKCCMNQ